MNTLFEEKHLTPHQVQNREKNQKVFYSDWLSNITSPGLWQALTGGTASIVTAANNKSYTETRNINETVTKKNADIKAWFLFGGVAVAMVAAVIITVVVIKNRNRE